MSPVIFFLMIAGILPRSFLILSRKARTSSFRCILVDWKRGKGAFEGALAVKQSGEPVKLVKKV
jgi:hypothetical protein